MTFAKNIISITSNRKVQHFLFWGFFVLLDALNLSSGHFEGDTKLFLYNAVSRFLSASIVVYMNFLVLIPKLLDRGKVFWYVISVIGTYITVVSLIYNFESVLLNDVNETVREQRHLTPIFGFTMLLLIASTMIHFTKKWIELKDVELQLRKEQSQRLEAELKTLKAQINPHFLFNSLNNIYSLSLDKSDLAPEMILKLSDLMSYIIYDARAEVVPIEQELEFIENHIKLESIRVKNRVKVDYKVEKELNGFFIAPLLFTPFIENSFKYVAGLSESESYININISEKEDNLVFVIENSCEEEAMPHNHDKHGIGIENVKKRLQLIYPKKHDLKIVHEGTVFKVEMKLLVFN